MNRENQKQMCEEELICSLLISLLNRYAIPLQSGKFCTLWVKFTTIKIQCLTEGEGGRNENMWKNENRHLCQFRFPIRVLVKARHGMDDWPHNIQQGYKLRDRSRIIHTDNRLCKGATKLFTFHKAKNLGFKRPKAKPL